MPYKKEIERRLRKADYERISKTLFIGKTFDTLTTDEYKKVMQVADVYGSKYKRIYRFKSDSDIRTLTSNLTQKNYSPNFSAHNNLEIIAITKGDDSFTIYTEFYTTEEVFGEPVTRDGTTYKELKRINVRRVMIIEKKSNSNYLILTIDPIGDGVRVYKQIDENLLKIMSLTSIDFGIFFDIIDIKNGIYKMVDDVKLIAKRMKTADKTTKRIKFVEATTSLDNIKDEGIYTDCKDNNSNLDSIKMKYKKEGVEVFGDTLLKITTTAGNEVTDEFTTELISAL